MQPGLIANQTSSADPTSLTDKSQTASHQNRNYVIGKAASFVSEPAAAYASMSERRPIHSSSLKRCPYINVLALELLVLRAWHKMASMHLQEEGLGQRQAPILASQPPSHPEAVKAATQPDLLPDLPGRQHQNKHAAFSSAPKQAFKSFQYW